MYRGLGWQKLGVMPRHSLSVDGVPSSATHFWKGLRPPADRLSARALGDRAVDRTQEPAGHAGERADAHEIGIGGHPLPGGIRERIWHPGVALIRVVLHDHAPAPRTQKAGERPPIFVLAQLPRERAHHGLRGKTVLQHVFVFNVFL